VLTNCESVVQKTIAFRSEVWGILPLSSCPPDFAAEGNGFLNHTFTIRQYDGTNRRLNVTRHPCPAPHATEFLRASKKSPARRSARRAQQPRWQKRWCQGPLREATGLPLLKRFTTPARSSRWPWREFMPPFSFSFLIPYK